MRGMDSVMRNDQNLVDEMSLGVYSRLGDAYRKERFVTLREKDTGG